MLLYAYTTLASAQDYRDYTQAAIGMDFALDMSRLEMDLETDGGTRPATLKRLGISLYDANVKGLTYGLLAGSSYLDIDDEPAASGEQLTGYHFGLALRAELLEQPRLRVGAYYLYQQTDASPDSGRINADWYEWQINSSLRIPLGAQWGMVVTGAYSDIDADLRVRGDTPGKHSLSLKGNTQGEIGLEMLYPGDGRASFTLVRGAQTGIRFQFGRVF